MGLQCYPKAVNTPLSRNLVSVYIYAVPSLLCIEFACDPIHTYSTAFTQHSDSVCMRYGNSEFGDMITFKHWTIILLSYSWTVYSVRPSKLFGFPINSSSTRHIAVSLKLPWKLNMNLNIWMLRCSTANELSVFRLDGQNHYSVAWHGMAIFFWINFQLFVYVPGEAGVSLSDLLNCMPHILWIISHTYSPEMSRCGRIWCDNISSIGFARTFWFYYCICAAMLVQIGSTSWPPNTERLNVPI